MVEKKESVPTEKTCFIVSPIGSEGSEVRKRADQVLKHVVRPPLESRGFKVVRADHIADPGMITTQVIDQIREAELVVADLTGHNPNVFYELAVRHALAKPFIQMIEAGEQIPFDIAGFRTIHIDHRDLDSANEAREEIGSQVDAIEKKDFKLVTPLSFSVDMTAFAKSGNQETVYISKLFDVVSSMQSQLMSLDRRMRSERTESRNSSEVNHMMELMEVELHELRGERESLLNLLKEQNALSDEQRVLLPRMYRSNSSKKS